MPLMCKDSSMKGKFLYACSFKPASSVDWNCTSNSQENFPFGLVLPLAKLPLLPLQRMAKV